MSQWDVKGSKPNHVDKDAIQHSELFLALISKHWIQDPLRIEELEYAKSLGKPIAVAIFDDVDPEPYLKDAKVIAKRVFKREQVENPDSPLAKALLQDFLQEIEEKMQRR